MNDISTRFAHVVTTCSKCGAKLRHAIAHANESLPAFCSGCTALRRVSMESDK